ncbi:hypothetical protein AB0J01_28245 [Streptomyces sp. NPDC050204]|uniref:hypothetical protein n=1 Tax=Streptomyces sp. NPDC050204 TaxID=3155514 RepID=UPI0034463741
MPVTAATAVVHGQEVERSVIQRLEAAGVECAPLLDGGGTYCQVSFADGSSIRWSGTDRRGKDVSARHPVGEHGSLSGTWHSEDENHQEDFLFAAGVYSDDSADLVAYIIARADRHGRAPASTL